MSHRFAIHETDRGRKIDSLTYEQLITELKLMQIRLDTYAEKVSKAKKSVWFPIIYLLYWPKVQWEYDYYSYAWFIGMKKYVTSKTWLKWPDQFKRAGLKGYNNSN